ncbi:MAG TPA: class I SAM-dependent DNA methyltransferase, partial [Thermoanaerobaculia bacterium]|nr:class I SAM-dependent DNA methyltransferase [Thermoanaerobaculia bacterium]
FPTPTDALSARIRALAEDVDAHRKRQQAAHTGLTLTGMYNVLEKLKSGEPLTPKEREIHEQGLVSILKQLHDELDLAVLEAYGWGDLAPLMEIVNGNAQPATAGVADREEARRALDEALLERLVALNAERAAEERRGLVRWLRPEFQRPEGAPAAAQDEIDLGEAAAAVVPVPRRPWPKTLTEQVKAVAEALASTPEPVTEAELAARFTARSPWRRRLANILEMLVTLGQARQEGSRYRAVGDAR